MVTGASNLRIPPACCPPPSANTKRTARPPPPPQERDIPQSHLNSPKKKLSPHVILLIEFSVRRLPAHPEPDALKTKFLLEFAAGAHHSALHPARTADWDAASQGRSRPSYRLRAQSTPTPQQSQHSATVNSRRMESNHIQRHVRINVGLRLQRRRSSLGGSWRRWLVHQYRSLQLRNQIQEEIGLRLSETANGSSSPSQQVFPWKLAQALNAQRAASIQSSLALPAPPTQQQAALTYTSTIRALTPSTSASNSLLLCPDTSSSMLPFPHQTPRRSP